MTDINNRPFLHTNRQIIKELPKVVIKDIVDDVKTEEAVQETLKEFDENVLPFLSLNYKDLLSVNNIHINGIKGENNSENSSNDAEDDNANNNSTNGAPSAFVLNNFGRNYIHQNKLDLNILFGDNSNLSSKDFLEKFDDLLNSDDENTKKFANMINDTFKKFNCKNKYDKEDLLDALFSALNKKGSCGFKHVGDIHSGYSLELIDLEKEAMENINKVGGIFNAVSAILESDQFYEDFMVGIDGYIDEYSQSNMTGDCWLLAGISALNATWEGKKVIHDAIEYDENKTITITFKGVEYPDGTKPVKITFPVETLKEAKEQRAATIGFMKSDDIEDNDKSPYSRGDNDVLALELATEILKTMIENNEIKVPAGGEYAELSRHSYNPFTGELLDGAGQSITGGLQQQILYFLTGNTRCVDTGHIGRATEEETLKFLEEVYGHVGSSKLNGNDAYAAYFGLIGGETATLYDGTTFEYDGGSHAFAIVDMTSTTVTFMEPHDSDVTYTMTWEEFAKLGARDLGATKVN